MFIAKTRNLEIISDRFEAYKEPQGTLIATIATKLFEYEKVFVRAMWLHL